MRIALDLILIFIMLASLVIGRLLWPLAPLPAGRFFDLGFLALVFFLGRRLYFLPHWIATGRER
jgi:hypothetical protein